ncbi:MAG TPA: HypC/HybG/HupF family hydrogenase formation chaperone [Chthoniobacterales bacterium]|jgi:hydrogenase maturation factor|nr:HypC/HybG/HupF family hydrogenase formation chaperone [Chthoniobacterales bacterium]
MNLLYAEVVDLVTEDEPKMARVRVAGALRQVLVGLLSDVQRGDRVLLCDGVAIAKVEEEQAEK